MDKIRKRVSGMLHLIVNPTAGNGRARKIGMQADEALTRQGVEHELFFTEHPGHASELSKRSAEQGVETVVAVGGDGTAFETAVGLINTKTALGIVPAGTGNDFIKSLKTPKKWDAALQHILSTPARPIDMGTMNDTYFLNECGTGFDVMVLDYALIAKKHVSGLLPYLYGVIRAIKNYVPFQMRIVLDDTTVLDGEFMVCSIANGRFIGGGIPISPIAEVADGYFDVVVLDNVPRGKLAGYLPGLMSGKILDFPITKHYRCKKCTLESPGMRLNIDGEIWPMEKAEFVCCEGALLLHW